MGLLPVLGDGPLAGYPRVYELAITLIAHSEGRVGLLEEHCLHRGTSLFYGRNEDCGLRCIYHGWKYDVAGKVLDGACTGNLCIARSWPVRSASVSSQMWLR
mgnify:CR=1 FL=1